MSHRIEMRNVSFKQVLLCRWGVTFSMWLLKKSIFRQIWSRNWIFFSFVELQFHQYSKWIEWRIAPCQMYFGFYFLDIWLKTIFVQENRCLYWSLWDTTKWKKNTSIAASNGWIIRMTQRWDIKLQFSSVQVQFNFRFQWFLKVGINDVL